MTGSYSFGRNLLVIGAGRVSTQFVGLLLIPVYASAMPASQFGVLDFAITVGAIVIPLATLQLDMAAFRFLIEARGSRSRTLSTIRRLLTTTLLQVTFWAFASVVAWQVLSSRLVLAVGVYICGLIASAMALQVARGLGRNGTFAVACIVTASFTVLGTWALVIASRGEAAGALTALGIANLAGAGYVTVAVPEVRRAVGHTQNRVALKPLLTYSVPLIPNAISWWIVSGLDRFIVPLYISLDALGVYAYAVRFSTILTALATIYSLAWSEAASLAAKSGSRDVDRHFRQVLVMFSLLTATVISGLAWALPMLTPVEYSGAMKFVPTLVVASCLYALTTFFGGLYVADFKSKRLASSAIAAAGVKALLAFTLIPAVGLWGAAVSTLTAYAILCIIRLVDLRTSHFALRLPRVELGLGGLAIASSVLAYHTLGAVVGLVMCALMGVTAVVLLVRWQLSSQ